MATYEVLNNQSASRFEATVDGHTAFAEYRLLDAGILFPHTETPRAIEGRGVATALIEAALAHARAEGLKVLPVCPFFAAYIGRHPETWDLVHPDYRRALHLD